jgi:hypothetical protein
MARKHHADIAGRNPRRPGGVKFLALGKRCALVKGAIRSVHGGAEQRRCFDYEDAVQSTVPIVVGEQPRGHAGFIARDDGSRSCDDGHATTTRSKKLPHSLVCPIKSQSALLPIKQCAESPNDEQN